MTRWGRATRSPSAEPVDEFAQVGVGVRMRHTHGWSVSLGARSTLEGGGAAQRRLQRGDSVAVLTGRSGCCQRASRTARRPQSATRRSIASSVARCCAAAKRAAAAGGRAGGMVRAVWCGARACAIGESGSRRTLYTSVRLPASRLAIAISATKCVPAAGQALVVAEEQAARVRRLGHVERPGDMRLGPVACRRCDVTSQASASNVSGAGVSLRRS